MIQDIYPHKLKNQYDPEKKPAEDSIIMAFRGNEVLMASDENSAVFPRLGDFTMDKERKASLQYLISIDETDCFMLAADAFDPESEAGIGDLEIPEGFSFRDSGKLRRMDIMPRENLFMEFTGHQIYRWYRDNRFCGTCGSRTEHSRTERAVVCTHCGRTIYPRILPAVIVGVTNGDRILMTKYADRPLAFYALIAGFTEIGETLEETVQREVMEEVGLKVKNIRYYKSQPWGVVDDILMGFYCDVDGDDTIRIDRHELKEGQWFRREDVQLQPTDFSLTNEMMREFKEGRQ